MASFDLFLPILLGFEGGYVNDPNDPGGETNMGITMVTFEETARPLLGIEPTSQNLKALTSAQAGVIYRDRYWNKMLGDSFTLQDLANIVCDFYVNAGTNATKLLQSTLQGFGGVLTVDGFIGPATMEVLNAYPQKDVYSAYKQGRIKYYQSLGAEYPMYLNGWMNRVNSFPDL